MSPPEPVLPPDESLRLRNAVAACGLALADDAPYDLEAAVQALGPRAGPRLRRYHDDLRRRLAAPDAAVPPSPPDSPPPHPARLGGKYELLERLGNGSMGEVWKAQQHGRLVRPVAVKFIRSGRDSSRSRERFAAEGNALARLVHPNVATVYEAEVDPTGRPYLVMEFIDGVPLTDYCRGHRLPLSDRLAVFLAACDGVAHAHQKSLLHLDLKPSNVLVSGSARGPVPKVIDFGIARSLADGERTDRSAGYTPEYAAPEQIAGGDVDTRADVYALGVILYELACGATPPPAAERCENPVADPLRPPSVRLTTASSDPRAACGVADPRRAARRVRGELDQIVLKAVAINPDDRYSSVAALAGDVRRYLADEPVEAVPPTRRYRWGKFVARNRLAVGAVAVAFLALVGGLVVASLGLREAWRQTGIAVDESRLKDDALRAAETARRIAQENERQANAAADKERIATALTAARLTQIELIGDTTLDIFLDFDIRKRRAGREPVEHVLAGRLIAAGKKLDEKAIHDPLLLAKLRNRLGHTLLSLGRAAAAIEPLAAAVAVRTANLGRNHPDTLVSEGNLALAYLDAGQLDKALPLLEESLDQTKARHGPDHADTCAAMNNLAVGYLEAGALGKALPLFEETLKRRTTTLGPDHADTLESRNNLAEGYQVAGWPGRALPLLEETLELVRAKHGPNHPDTLRSANNLAMGDLAAGRFGRARPLIEETFARAKTELGPDHPLTLTVLGNRGLIDLRDGRFGQALPLLEEAFRLTRAKFGPGHPRTLSARLNLAKGYSADGRFGEVLPLLEETLELCAAKLGPNHPDTIRATASRALGYLHAGKLGRARPLLEEAFKLAEVKLGPIHPDTLAAAANWAEGHRHAGQLDKAVPLLEKTLKLCTEHLGPVHPDTLTCQNNLATAYLSVGRFDDALRLLEEVQKRRTEHLGPDHPDTLTSAGNLAEGFSATGRSDKALPLSKEVFKRCTDKFGPDHPNTLAAASNLAEQYREAGRPDEALLARTLERRTTVLGPYHPDTLTSQNNWAVFLRNAGRLDEALPLLAETLRLREAKLGPEHTHTLASTNNLAVGYLAAGRPDAAVPLLEKALELTKAKVGPDHSDALRCANNLAMGYRLTGRPEKAISLFEETLERRTAKLGPDHPDTIHSQGNLGLAYCEAKRGKDGARRLSEFVAARRKRSPKESPRFADLLADVSAPLLNCGQFAPATEMLRECLAIREKAMPDAWVTFDTRSRLGGALARSRKYAEAEPLLLSGYKGLSDREKAIPPGATAVPDALDRLIGLYTTTEKPDEVTRYRRLRAAYPPEVAPRPKAVR